MHPKKERTFVILKPDAVQRSLVGEILSRFERVGLKIIGLKFCVADEQRLLEHYGKDDAWYQKKGEVMVQNLKDAGKEVTKEALEYGKDIIRSTITYMKCGPVLMIAYEGNQAVAVVKKLVGRTEPCTSDVGTIRGDYTLDSLSASNGDNRGVRNLVHCSDAPETAEREIGIWFTPEELLSYRLVQDEILYDVNLDGILE